MRGGQGWHPRPGCAGAVAHHAGSASGTKQSRNAAQQVSQRRTGPLRHRHLSNEMRAAGQIVDGPPQHETFGGAAALEAFDRHPALSGRSALSELGTRAMFCVRFPGAQRLYT